MYLKHVTSLQFLTYVSFFAVLLAAMFRFVPGRTPPTRDEPYSDEELHAHDRKPRSISSQAASSSCSGACTWC